MNISLREAVASANAIGIDGRSRGLYYALLSLAMPNGEVPRVRRGILAANSGRSGQSIQNGIVDLIDCGAVIGGNVRILDGYLVGAAVRVFRAAAEPVLPNTAAPVQERQPAPALGVGFSTDAIE